VAPLLALRTMAETFGRLMPKKAAPLNALAVSRLSKPGFHAVGTVPGLLLQVTPTGAKTWVFRVMVGTRRRHIGLGGYPETTLAMAHEKARQARGQIAAGVDPIEQRKASKSALMAAQAKEMTFEQCAAAFITAKESEWSNVKHAQQWRNTLATHAFPKMGRLLVRDVALPHVLAVLEPIWTTKTETATRLRGRIESVLDWATTRQYRDGLNPARWQGHLDTLLPAPGKVTKVEHHPAVAVGDAGAFMARLRQQAGMGARALEFVILTATRSGEVRGATWGEFDLAAALWVIPADRMKMKIEHRVPLSSAAVKLLQGLPRIEKNNLVFSAPRGGQLSDMTLTAVMRRMKVDAVPHGFRSTFRDWASERTNYPRDVAEMALAHAIGDKVEAAYRRGDLFEKRRRMMASWAAFLEKVEATGEVIPINKAA
jgi:integrase